VDYDSYNRERLNDKLIADEDQEQAQNLFKKLEPHEDAMRTRVKGYRRVRRDELQEPHVPVLPDDVGVQVREGQKDESDADACCGAHMHLLSQR